MCSEMLQCRSLPVVFEHSQTSKWHVLEVTQEPLENITVFALLQIHINQLIEINQKAGDFDTFWMEWPKRMPFGWFSEWPKPSQGHC